jgi:hypothetical protein
MDPRARGFAVPAALSVVVIAGLAAECKSDSGTSTAADAGDDSSVDASDGSVGGGGGADGADAPVIVLGGSGGTLCGGGFSTGACPGVLVCVDGGADAETPCCQCFVA